MNEKKRVKWMTAAYIGSHLLVSVLAEVYRVWQHFQSVPTRSPRLILLMIFPLYFIPMGAKTREAARNAKMRRTEIFATAVLCYDSLVVAATLLIMLFYGWGWIFE